MPLDELVERILADSREEASSIVGQAERERDRLLAEADAEADGLYQRQLGALKSRAEEEKKQRIAMEALEARKETLGERRSLLEDAISKAVRRLVGERSELYLGLMARKLSEDAASGSGEVILSPADRESIGSELIKRANGLLQESGKAAGLLLADETRDMEGGYVLRVGEVEVNSSLEALIQSNRERIEARLVEVLFGGEKEPEEKHAVE